MERVAPERRSEAIALGDNFEAPSGPGMYMYYALACDVEFAAITRSLESELEGNTSEIRVGLAPGDLVTVTSHT